MANMSYCRFRNTLQDLEDCNVYMWDTDLSSDESAARTELIKLCKQIAEEHD